MAADIGVLNDIVGRLAIWHAANRGEMTDPQARECAQAGFTLSFLALQLAIAESEEGESDERG